MVESLDKYFTKRGTFNHEPVLMPYIDDPLTLVTHNIYIDWIESNVSPKSALSNCALWCLVMKREFPELKIVEGDVKTEWWPSWYHEYLITPKGHKVDPTRIQFDMMFGEKWEYLS